VLHFSNLFQGLEPRGETGNRQVRRARPRPDAGFRRACVLPPRLKGRKLAPRVGFEPTTGRLTVDCSTAELPRSNPPRRTRRPLCRRPKDFARGYDDCFAKAKKPTPRAIRR